MRRSTLSNFAPDNNVCDGFLVVWILWPLNDGLEILLGIIVDRETPILSLRVSSSGHLVKSIISLCITITIVTG
jgi:hypothetical protein